MRATDPTPIDPPDPIHFIEIGEPVSIKTLVSSTAAASGALAILHFVLFLLEECLKALHLGLGVFHVLLAIVLFLWLRRNQDTVVIPVRSTDDPPGGGKPSPDGPQ